MSPILPNAEWDIGVRVQKRQFPLPLLPCHLYPSVQAPCPLSSSHLICLRALMTCPFTFPSALPSTLYPVSWPVLSCPVLSCHVLPDLSCPRFVRVQMTGDWPFPVTVFLFHVPVLLPLMSVCAVPVPSGRAPAPRSPSGCVACVSPAVRVCRCCSAPSGQAGKGQESRS